MTTFISWFVPISLVALATLFCSLAVYEAHHMGPRDEVPACPEMPTVPPIIKHHALKDRLAMKQHALHGREVHELDQGGPRG